MPCILWTLAPVHSSFCIRVTLALFLSSVIFFHCFLCYFSSTPVLYSFGFVRKVSRIYRERKTDVHRDWNVSYFNLVLIQPQSRNEAKEFSELARKTCTLGTYIKYEAVYYVQYIKREYRSEALINVAP